MKVPYEVRVTNAEAYLNELYSLARDKKAFYSSKIGKKHHLSSYMFQAVIDMNVLVVYRESPHSLARIDWICGKKPDREMAESICDKASMLAIAKPHSKKPFPEKPERPAKMKIWVNGVAVNLKKSDSLDIEVNNVHSIIRLLDQ